MRRTLTIAARELAAYLYSPIFYVVMTLFVIFSSAYFVNWFIRAPEANMVMRQQFAGMGWILLLAAPILTMRLLAEEKRAGTIETLMTSPVTETQVVLGKFLAGFAFFMALLVPSLAYVILVRELPDVAPDNRADLGPIVAGYAGLVCMGLVCVAIGLFASAFTRSQLVAAMVSLVVLVLFGLLPSLAGLAGGSVGAALGYVGIFARLHSFRKGLIDLRDVFFFLSTAALFLFLAVRVLETRKWK